MDRNYNVKNFISKSFTLERSRVAKFADIVKMATIFIKTTFKDSNKVKEIRNFVSKCNLYLYFLIQQKYWSQHFVATLSAFREQPRKAHPE